MLINPLEAIEKGWIKNITDPKKQVQPNAIDFTLDQLYTIENKSSVITETTKIMCGNVVCPPVSSRYATEQGWFLLPGSCYDGMSNIHVTLPEGIACLLIIRSTLNRNGLLLTSGMYDSGYSGSIGFALHNRGKANAFIGQGTRVGQIMFIKSDSVGLYTGGYNHKEGTHWSQKEETKNESK